MMTRDLFREGRDLDAARVRSTPEGLAEKCAHDPVLAPNPSRSLGVLIIRGVLRFWQAV
jgi:hypothetical protein